MRLFFTRRGSIPASAGDNPYVFCSGHNRAYAGNGKIGPPNGIDARLSIWKPGRHYLSSFVQRGGR
jgi:hypothetical protein